MKYPKQESLFFFFFWITKWNWYATTTKDFSSAIINLNNWYLAVILGVVTSALNLGFIFVWNIIPGLKLVVLFIFFYFLFHLWAGKPYTFLFFISFVGGITFFFWSRYFPYSVCLYLFFRHLYAISRQIWLYLRRINQEIQYTKFRSHVKFPEYSAPIWSDKLFIRCSLPNHRIFIGEYADLIVIMGCGFTPKSIAQAEKIASGRAMLRLNYSHVFPVNTNERSSVVHCRK